MGHGTFDSSSSAARAAFRRATGTSAFRHDADAKAGRAAALQSSLDLRRKPRRECRDNADNPISVPIAVITDVTGSMGGIADLILDDLNVVVKVIRETGVVPHPSLLFGAIGDAFTDNVPIQMGEFESDDELAEMHLANIYKEGNGGGQTMESYELALWFFANQVDTDHWEKRGEKGFLFIIGDEAPHQKVTASQVREHCGTTIPWDISLPSIAGKVQERWHVFLLRPGGTACFYEGSVPQAWCKLLPSERVIDVEDWQQIVPVIAGTISMMGGLSAEATLRAMRSSGFKGRQAEAATNVAAHVTRSAEIVRQAPSLPSLFRKRRVETSTTRL